MQLWPDLATDLGRHNDDFTAWEFTVRPGVRFQDGTPVTARDVVRGVRRCLHVRVFPTSPCLTGGPIRSVTAKGHNVVRFDFGRPFPDFAYLAATPAIGPVPPGTAPVYGPYAGHPLATGPYRIDRYRRGRVLVLVRNPEWDPATDPARTQYPDRYVVRAGAPRRDIERVLLADKGPAQTSLTYDTVRPEPFDRSSATRRRLVLGQNPCTTYWAPDVRTLADPRVRHALAYAFPYRAVMRAEGLVPNATAIPATNVLPPDVPGRTPYRIDHRAAFETDPDGARALLTRAHALGTPIRFTYDPRAATSRLIRTAIVRSLGASGFEPRPEETIPGGLAQTLDSVPRVDVRMDTWCGMWNTGGAWFPYLFGAGRNPSGERFSNPAVDRRMHHIARIPLEQQPAAWNVLDRQVMRRWFPLVPLWYGGVVMAHGSRIEGMGDDSVRGMPTWQQLWVSP
jgi:peptide/nickel transport system substrate-binding protein